MLLFQSGLKLFTLQLYFLSIFVFQLYLKHETFWNKIKQEKKFKKYKQRASKKM